MCRTCSSHGSDENAYKIVLTIPEGRVDHLEEPGVKGKIILEQILTKQNVRVWTVSSGLRIGSSGGVF
jgi:hypothetical protein